MSNSETTACTMGWTTERIIRIVAGFMVLSSLALGAPASPFFMSAHWLWLTLFVGANLFQSGFTRFCPLDTILKRGFKVQGEADAARRAA
jgi:hypothetical protein